MRKQIILSILVSMIMAGPAWTQDVAVDEERRTVALELLKVLQVEERMQKQLEEMKEYQKNLVQSQEGAEAPNPEEVAQQEQMWQQMEKALSWENIKDEYIQIYAETFTKEELQGIRDFFQSPSGQAYIEKSPTLQMKLMQLSQKQLLSAGAADEAEVPAPETENAQPVEPAAPAAP